jgi:hypothetical protein
MVVRIEGIGKKQFLSEQYKELKQQNVPQRDAQGNLCRLRKGM